MEAHVLSLNEFSKPKVFDNPSEAAYVNIIYLILCSKGRYQSHPDMGVGLRERYRYNNEDDLLNTLQQDITSQIEQYLPSLSLVDVSLTLRDGKLGIIIDTTEGIYVVAYDSIKDNMEAAATYILDDL
jgi:hypothetical protein